MNIANQITLVRLFLIPMFAYSAFRYGQSIAYQEIEPFWRLLAISLFLVASLSDWLDGFLARRLKLHSTLGKILDPLTDKFLILSALSIFTVLPWHPLGWQLPWWLLALTIVRDIIILGGVSILHLRKKLQNFSPTWLGKTTTATQMITLASLMLHLFPPAIPALITAILTTLSGCQYLQKGLRQMRSTSRAH